MLLVFLNRKRFIIQHKFIALYKTKLGLNLMDTWSEKYGEYLRVLGFIGIGAGFIGLITMLVFLIKNLVELVIVPNTQSAVSLVVPGVAVPGSPVTIPLISGWLALFLVVVVHEFSHGVIARVHKIPILSSGIFFMGPLMGAFVEPDEKKLKSSADTAQYSVYAAGPFSNMLLTLVCIGVLTFLLNPLAGAMADPMGVAVVGVSEGLPAAQAGLADGMIITEVNGIPVLSADEFSGQLKNLKPGESVEILADHTKHTMVAGKNPKDPNLPHIGILVSGQPAIALKYEESWSYRVLFWLLNALIELLAVTGLLSLGIGLANLLPLGPVDGGRMMQVMLGRAKGKRKGDYVWKKISFFTLMVLAINLAWPVLAWAGRFLLTL